ncbi:MAG: hypothetical protein M1820_005143 [Bogoriella megaspora]|nr:MAG: hypothetical protein M1820_005143 [Bogoriella megaspora]
MDNLANLRDTRSFPAFADCPDENDIRLDYYRTTDGFMFNPSRHWCLLGEVTDKLLFLRLRLWLKDRDGGQVPMHFHLEDGDSAQFQHAKEGDTVAVLYAHRHGFTDFSVGIRQETVCSLKVPPIPNQQEECQTQGWVEKGHKDDCKILKDKDVQGLFKLDWEQFTDYARFPFEDNSA